MAERRLGFLRGLVVAVVKPVMTIMTRRTWSGMENVPPVGGVIIVANHLSHVDPLVCAHYVYDAGRWPQFLAKAGVFRLPVVGWLLRRVRQIPVDRGSADAIKSLDELVTALEQGGAVIVYPEGTTTREPDLWPMRPKTGAARLALATGAPVVPLAMWGPQRIFDPRTKRIRPRPRTPVAVKAGPPVDLSRWAGSTPTRAILEEMSEVIMLRVRDLVADLRGGTPPPLYVPPAAGRRAGEPDGLGRDNVGAAVRAVESAPSAPVPRRTAAPGPAE